MRMSLTDLSEDVLLIIILHLDVADILSVRKTCRQLNELTRFRSIWQKACNHFIIGQGLPFPYRSLNDVEASVLELWTRRVLAVKDAWVHNDEPRRTLSFVGGPLNGLQNVHLVFGGGNEWIITVSEGIWPVITCWDLRCIVDGAPTKVGEWSCRGATIRDVIVNSNLTRDAYLTVEVDNYSEYKRYIEIQRIRTVNGTSCVTFETVMVLDTDYSPVLLDGDTLVISDEYSEAHVMNWRTGAFTILKGSAHGDDVIQHNKCLQVLFAHKSILVARSRSIDLFPEVDLSATGETGQVVNPLKTYSFGWIDGIAMSLMSSSLHPQYPAIAILIRAESGDPWASDIHSVKYHLAHPEASFDPSDESQATSSCPYQFPPSCITAIAAKREFMRCPKLALGPAGTSVWVGGIGTSKVQELWSMIWPGAIRNATDPGQTLFSKLYKTQASGGELWTSMDYVESRGCVALGSVGGKVTILYLVD